MKRFILSFLFALISMSSITSLISCSDRIDDELTVIRSEMADNMVQIDSQLVVINGLLAKYDSTILNNTNEITALKDNLSELQKDYVDLNSRTTKNEEDIIDLKKRIKELEYAVYDLNNLIKNAVSDVIVQETMDCIVGTINLPGFNPGFLSAYVGENCTGYTAFPVAGETYNIDPDGNYLLNTEIRGEKVWNSGEDSYLIHGIGNAGKIYFTLNPLKVDANFMAFDLVNSIGEVSPIKLSNVKPSDHLITYAIGKHGNGIVGTRGDNMVYLYEADATIGLDGVEKIHYDYTKFGYQNEWNIVGFNMDADPNSNNVVGRFKYLLNEVAAGNTKDVLEYSLELIQNFYNGLYSQRTKLQKQALRVTWNDGNNAVVSPFDITTVTINPFSYGHMRLLDKFNNPNYVFNDYDGIVNKIATFVRSKMPTVHIINLKWDDTDGKLAVYDNSNNIIGYVDLQGENGIITNLVTLSNSVNEVLADYNTIKVNTNGDQIMARINSFLKHNINSARLIFDNQPAWRLTEPILLFDSQRYGIKRLQPGMSFNGENIPFIMTSLTEEYIVPVYMKYIAVLYDGKVRQSYILRGNEKLVKLDIPNDKCEIVYQTSDYYGNIVTKRYSIN